MNKSKERRRQRRAEYWRRTWQNKFYAVALIMLSSVPAFIDHDATALVMALLVGIPMFFSNENWIL